MTTELILHHADMTESISNIVSMKIKSIRPLQFNYLSYEFFLEKKSCQTPKKKKKKSSVVS